MWELIEANKRKSWILFFGMGMCLLILGYLIGAAFAPDNGGMFGLGIAAGIWVALSLISYFSGDSILLAVSRAKTATHNEKTKGLIWRKSITPSSPINIDAAASKSQTSGNLSAGKATEKLSPPYARTTVRMRTAKSEERASQNLSGNSEDLVRLMSLSTTAMTTDIRSRRDAYITPAARDCVALGAQ